MTSELKKRAVCQSKSTAEEHLTSLSIEVSGGQSSKHGAQHNLKVEVLF
jgi:hypothetical protein